MSVNPNALAQGTEIHWYRLARVLGHGGFGITYLALDANLDQAVAIKEYLPAAIATRGSDGRVLPVSPDQLGDYQWGLDRFISEGRTLAKFDHPNIVRVLSVFEANDTAYLVMRFEQGQTLAHSRGTPPRSVSAYARSMPVGLSRNRSAARGHRP